MNEKELILKWKNEEKNAVITGWDFSYIDGRYCEDTSFPWDYREVIKKYLTPDMKLLDIDTGGGEFLLSIKHPFRNCAASEGYVPNVALCEKKLLPLGIDFRKGVAKNLPFDNASFDIVINRHGDFCPKEIKRVLKKGGLFITQQVGAENDREFVELLYGRSLPLPYPEQYLCKAKEKFILEGFRILECGECKKPMRFYDTGALVWFCKIIEWEFVGFSVEKCIENLYKAKKIIEEIGKISCRTHRFYFAAKKN